MTDFLIWFLGHHTKLAAIICLVGYILIMFFAYISITAINKKNKYF